MGRGRRELLEREKELTRRARRPERQRRGIDWYTRFFGRAPDMRVGDEVLWDTDEHATLFIEPNPGQAGAGRVTFAVTGLDALLEGLAARGIGPERIETYSSGVRHATVPDPDGNAIAFAELVSRG